MAPLTERTHSPTWGSFALVLALATLASRVRLGDSGWIDPATTEASLTVTSYEDGRVHALVMSDEFTDEGRTFDNGHDPKWTALNKDDFTNDALQFYASDHVTTINGMLNITVSATDTTFAQEPKKGKRRSMTKTCVDRTLSRSLPRARLRLRTRSPGRSAARRLPSAVSRSNAGGFATDAESEPRVVVGERGAFCCNVWNPNQARLRPLACVRPPSTASTRDDFPPPLPQPATTNRRLLPSSFLAPPSSRDGTRTRRGALPPRDPQVPLGDDPRLEQVLLHGRGRRGVCIGSTDQSIDRYHTTRATRVVVSGGPDLTISSTRIDHEHSRSDE